MNDVNEKNLGPQPIADLMAKHNLKSHDLVAVLPAQQLTHKMVTRACKGRKLTGNSKFKIQSALNLAAKTSYKVNELFNY